MQVETMSPAQSVTTLSGSDIPITYDVNLAFAPIHIFDQPGVPSFSSPSSDSNAQVAGATVVSRAFKFSPSRDFWYWPLITITWDNPNFAFSNCVNADIGNQTAVTPLPTNLYTCSI
jgi:hypothetical protein